MTPSDRARAEHENNRDRCPIHHRPLTPSGMCPACKADSAAAETVDNRIEYNGEVSVVGVAEALGARDAHDQNESREQADLWRYARGDR